MYYSGIADEAGKDIDTQIKAHLELGWKHIELRTVGGENITQLSDAKFDAIAAKLAEAGLQVSCFGSAIANWARPITIDPQVDIDDLKQAIPRMKRLGTEFIRVMSYPNDEKNPLPEDEWRDASITRMRTLAEIAGGAGITLVHENCSGWGGLSAENCMEMMEEINSWALRIVFDTGNPVTYGQDAWSYYKTVEEFIAYVHIKDAKRVGDVDEYCYCGEGDGAVKQIVGDLLANGYEGGFSIEPHLAAVIHTGQEADSAEQLYKSYTEYGKRFMEIVEDVTASA